MPEPTEIEEIVVPEPVALPATPAAVDPARGELLAQQLHLERGERDRLRPRLLFSRLGIRISPFSRSTRSSVSVTPSVNLSPTVPMKRLRRLIRSGIQEASSRSCSYSSATPSSGSCRTGGISKMPGSTRWPREAAARSACLSSCSSFLAATGVPLARAAMWSSIAARWRLGTGVPKNGAQGRIELSRNSWTEIRDAFAEKRERPIFDPVPSPTGTYSLLYVDPPWRYEHGEPSRAIENQYPTMELDELKQQLPPAAPDSVMFMWATSPKLSEAFERLDAGRAA